MLTAARRSCAQLEIGLVSGTGDRELQWLASVAIPGRNLFIDNPPGIIRCFAGGNDDTVLADDRGLGLFDVLSLEHKMAVLVGSGGRPDTYHFVVTITSDGLKDNYCVGQRLSVERYIAGHTHHLKLRFAATAEKAQQDR